VLTTNFRGQLDPALIRSGRVDAHVEFRHADRKQMAATGAPRSSGAHPTAHARDYCLQQLRPRTLI
jgi:hypothetical protein